MRCQKGGPSRNTSRYWHRAIEVNIYSVQNPFPVMTPEIRDAGIAP
jgi:hypothetical protein